MNINSNKGMYIEELINRTISYYYSKNIGYFEKRNIPFKLIKKINESCFVGKLYNKSTVDYFGYYRSFHFEFEAKQTDSLIFNFKQIKPHQLLFLKNINLMEHALSFVIISFFKSDKTFLLPINNLVKYVKENKKSTITLNELSKCAYKLEIIYPGILNLKEVLDQFIESL